jgi:hypothetical protein
MSVWGGNGAAVCAKMLDGLRVDDGGSKDASFHKYEDKHEPYSGHRRCRSLHRHHRAEADVRMSSVEDSAQDQGQGGAMSVADIRRTSADHGGGGGIGGGSSVGLGLEEKKQLDEIGEQQPQRGNGATEKKRVSALPELVLWACRGGHVGMGVTNLAAASGKKTRLME